VTLVPTGPLTNIARYLQAHGTDGIERIVLRPLAKAPLISVLIATLGPRSADSASEMAAEGATAFRLNASHLRPRALAEFFASVGRAPPGPPVRAHLPGAKVPPGSDRPPEIDPIFVLGTLGLSLLDGAIAGLYPSWRIGRTAPAVYLKTQ